MIETTKAVNLSQLGYEMGGVSLRSVGPDEEGVTRIRGLEDGPTDAQITAALKTHQADIDFVHPDAVVREAIEESEKDRKEAARESGTTKLKALGLSTEEIAALTT